jgi:hypothetical protein
VAGECRERQASSRLDGRRLPVNFALGVHKRSFKFYHSYQETAVAVSLPYLPSNKNVEALFSKIQSAKVPDRFSQDFLKTTIGLKGSNDRPLIPLLRTLGFLDQTGAPTPTYRLLKNSATSKSTIAAAVRKAYAPLFESNESAQKLPNDKLKGLIAQVAGTDDDMTSRIASTFNTLSKLGDFDHTEQPATSDEDVSGDEEAAGESIPDLERSSRSAKGGGAVGRGALQPAFHYNIQVHLPSNGSEEVYLNIFNALRKAFQ